jgi:hypothetical protein
MQVRVQQIAKIWGIKTVEEFLQHLDTSLNCRYSRNVTRFARKFWDCQDRGKGEVTLLFLLDICRAFHLVRLSDLLEFDSADCNSSHGYNPTIREEQPHLIVTSRIDEIIQADLGTTRSSLKRQKIVTQDLLELVGQPTIDSERPFFLGSLDKIGAALSIPTLDRLFEVKVVAQPLLQKTPPKAPTRIRGAAYEAITLSA